MRSVELAKPTVPISYVLLTLELAQERGVDRAVMLQGMGVAPEQLRQADARLGLLQYGRLCVRALQLTGDPALGYEFGLRNKLTTHGLVGFGLMSQPTVRDAIEFATRFFVPLRLPGWEMRFALEGDEAVIEGRETVPYGILRQYALDMLLVSLVSTYRPFVPANPAFELRFDCPEPAYYARYHERLPPARFDAAANQLRMPAAYLSRPIETANAVSAQMVQRECEREMALLGLRDDLLERVRAALVNREGQYPDQESLATQLHLSTRTLVRRLGEHGSGYQQLLDEARHRDAVRLLEDPTLTLSDIAARLGYSTAANFSRAFQGWTGLTPGRFRSRSDRM